MKFYQLLENEQKTQLLRNIPSEILTDLKFLETVFKKSGFQIRIVGGAVRDLLLNKKPKDIDLATDATPDESMTIAEANNIKVIPTGLQHGTVTFVINGEGYEITTLRIDTETDGRHATVQFTRSWEQDAERRDLTVNAMSLGLDGTLYDYFNGAKDLSTKTMRFVGQAEKRIQEDYLRILRYFRFMGRFSSTNWPDGTKEAIKNNANGLANISGERIWSELKQILSGANTGEIMDAMCELGVSAYTLISCDYIASAERTRQFTNNPVTIYSSMLTSMDQVAKAVARFKWSRVEQDLSTFLVQNKGKKYSLENYQDLLVDGVKLDWIIELVLLQGNNDIAQKLKSWNIPVFPITGNDMISKGIKPGKEMGIAMKQLKDIWKKSRFTLSKEELLDKIPTVRTSYTPEEVRANQKSLAQRLENEHADDPTKHDEAPKDREEFLTWIKKSTIS